MSHESTTDGPIASELLQKWVSVIKQGDPNQVTLLYDKRALLLGTFSAKERVGHGAISEYFENLLKNPVSVEIVSEHPIPSELEWGWSTVSSSVFGAVTVNSGLYNFVLPDKTVEARFSFVYGRTARGSSGTWEYGDSWKIISHHSSVLPEAN